MTMAQVARDALKSMIWERDGHICRLCFLPISLDDVHLDHIIPRMRGGLDMIDNLQSSHRACNSAKRDREWPRPPKPTRPVTEPIDPDGMVTNSEAARQLAALRKREEKTCPICGTVFMAFGKQKYDTKSCANKASYQRVGRSRRPATEAAGGEPNAT